MGVVLLALVGIANAEMPADIKAQVKAAAFDKWDDDFQMVKYQITKETEAYNRLQTLSPGTVPEEVWLILQKFLELYIYYQHQNHLMVVM